MCVLVLVFTCTILVVLVLDKPVCTQVHKHTQAHLGENARNTPTPFYSPLPLTARTYTHTLYPPRGFRTYNTHTHQPTPPFIPPPQDAGQAGALDAHAYTRTPPFYSPYRSNTGLPKPDILSLTTWQLPT